jgi:uncharacterized protein YjiK
MKLGRAGGLLMAALATGSCGHKPAPEETTFNLPAELSEISGLAAAGPNSVFAHEDEFAIIYELGLTDGKVKRAFALGEPTLEGDFEGIATAGQQVFLLTSDGLIYAATPGRNGARVPYRVYDSGVGPHCETEGLSEAPEAERLLLLCKRRRNDAGEPPSLDIYVWQIGSERAEEKPWLSRPLDSLMSKSEREGFRPSSLDWDPRTGRLLIVSAQNRLLLTLDRTGRLIDKRRLKKGRHPQTEGMAIMPDGRLVLSDEGSKNREARLTVYPMP